jgi:uncharacterized membrane protein
MGIATVGQALFAATFIALGILGFASGDFTPLWQPVPKDFPAREGLAYLTALVSLATGVGLLFRPTAKIAARVLLAALMLWLLLVRLPRLVMNPGSIDTWFGVCETAVYVAGAWMMRADAAGQFAVRASRALFGLSLLLFGVAHFIYINETASLVPAWLPAHLAFAYATGCTYIAAGIAILAARVDRLAAILATWQMGLFTVLIWVPIVSSGAPNAFTWSEFVVSCALTVSSWVFAESYRRSVELRA